MFLSRPFGPGLMQCRRKKGDVLRYDTTTTEFGVLSVTGVIRTYFKPVPCVSLPPGAKLNCHRQPTNLD